MCNLIFHSTKSILLCIYYLRAKSCEYWDKRNEIYLTWNHGTAEYIVQKIQRNTNLKRTRPWKMNESQSLLKVWTIYWDQIHDIRLWKQKIQYNYSIIRYVVRANPKKYTGHYTNCLIWQDLLHFSLDH